LTLFCFAKYCRILRILPYLTSLFLRFSTEIVIIDSKLPLTLHYSHTRFRSYVFFFLFSFQGTLNEASLHFHSFLRKLCQIICQSFL